MTATSSATRLQTQDRLGDEMVRPADGMVSVEWMVTRAGSESILSRRGSEKNTSGAVLEFLSRLVLLWNHLSWGSFFKVGGLVVRGNLFSAIVAALVGTAFVRAFAVETAPTLPASPSTTASEAIRPVAVPASPAQAAAATSCIPLAEAETLKQEVQLPATFTNDDLCNPKSYSYKLMETVLFMKNNRFPGDKVPPPLDQNILPDNFWEFFIKDVRKISNQNAGPSCQGVIAFVLTGFGDGEINLCPAFYADKTAMIERVSVLMHEARHLDPRLYRHARCESGYSKGRNSCDPTFETKGSYAVSVESLAKLIASPLFSAQDKAYGKMLLMQYLTRAFNSHIQLGVGHYTAVHLIDSHGQNQVFDGLGSFEIPALPGSHFVNRYFSYLAAPTETGDVSTIDMLSPTLTISPPLTESLIKFNETPIEQRSKIVAVLNQETYQGMITAKDVTVHPLPTIALNFTAEQVFTAEALGKAEINSFYIRATDGNLYRVNWDKKEVKITQANEDWDLPFNAKSVIAFSGQRIALKDSGELMIFENGGWNPYAPFIGRTFKYLSSPFLWNRALFN